MSFFLPIATLWWRELVRFYRQPSRLLGALGTPFIFWLLIGSGIGASFRPPSTSADISYLRIFLSWDDCHGGSFYRHFFHHFDY